MTEELHTTYTIHSDQLPLGEMRYGASKGDNPHNTGRIIEAVREERRLNTCNRRVFKANCGHLNSGFDLRFSAGRRKFDRSTLGVSIMV